MRWEQIDFKTGLVQVTRLKNGLPSTHPIRGTELRALRALRKDYPDSPYLFVTERKGPMTPATARKIIMRAGELAKFPFPIHPHMLRHSAGYKFANDGQDTRAIQQYLGHRNITHTVRYTELSPIGSRVFGRIRNGAQLRFCLPRRVVNGGQCSLHFVDRRADFVTLGFIHGAGSHLGPGHALHKLRKRQGLGRRQLEVDTDGVVRHRCSP